MHFELDEKQTFCFNPGCTPRFHQDFRLSAVGDIVRARLTVKTNVGMAGL
jgi:hypothetical protein